MLYKLIRNTKLLISKNLIENINQSYNIVGNLYYIFFFQNEIRIQVWSTIFEKKYKNTFNMKLVINFISSIRMNDSKLSMHT